MSYDVHVVRTEDCFDASDKPITQQDVNGLISADPEHELNQTAATLREQRATTWNPRTI